jgi:hypothetical protein
LGRQARRESQNSQTDSQAQRKCPGSGRSSQLLAAAKEGRYETQPCHFTAALFAAKAVDEKHNSVA